MWRLRTGKFSRDAACRDSLGISTEKMLLVATNAEPHGDTSGGHIPLRPTKGRSGDATGGPWRGDRNG